MTHTAPEVEDPEERYISCRFSKDTRSDLKIIAARLDRSMISLIREAVERDLPRLRKLAGLPVGPESQPESHPKARNKRSH